ncbi:MAG TPA: hypothetical protein VFI86_06040, partial [Burkholderiales bacterium]|nr:hypothetical protein [Burkholderiales bacterium]
MKKIPLLASLALAACTVGPDYRRPALEVPAQYPAALAPQAGGLPADWWKLYGDAALDELVETARRNNSDLRLAAARVQEAEGALREAR